jgi:DNA-binding MarR family transcriptional regulator
MRRRISRALSTACEHCKAILEEGLELSGAAGEPRGAIVYRGTVEDADERREWDEVREDDVLRSHSPAEIAQRLAPFGSAERVALLYALYTGERTQQDLCEETGLTQGQLYHHIKDLLYLGYAVQRGRNRYSITGKGRQALLTVVTMLDDFARH